MIKLICSDLDGTLIHYGESGIAPEVFSLINRLYEKGMLFAPASGRQFSSLRRVFAPVADKCFFLCENGGVVCDSRGKIIGKTPISHQTVEELVKDFWDRSDGIGEVMLSGENLCYLLERGKGVLNGIIAIGNNCKVIRDLSEIPEEVVKVSLFVDGKSSFYADRFTEKWSSVNCAVAGPSWIDCTLANKGTGVLQLAGALNIHTDDIVAFGDNYNDVAMLDLVGHPYIMNTAVAELREKYKNRMDHPVDIMKELLSVLT